MVLLSAAVTAGTTPEVPAPLLLLPLAVSRLLAPYCESALRMFSESERPPKKSAAGTPTGVLALAVPRVFRAACTTLAAPFGVAVQVALTTLPLPLLLLLLPLLLLLLELELLLLPPPPPPPQAAIAAQAPTSRPIARPRSTIRNLSTITSPGYLDFFGDGLLGLKHDSPYRTMTGGEAKPATSGLA
jgi:hypothetical protein